MYKSEEIIVSTVDQKEVRNKEYSKGTKSKYRTGNEFARRKSIRLNFQNFTVVLPLKKSYHGEKKEEEMKFSKQSGG